MKIIRFAFTGPPSVLECVEVPVPVPGAGEVLVRAHSIGVGIPDTLIRSGAYGWMPPLPATPGTELAGTVAAVGPGVTRFRPGDLALLSARERKFRGGHYAEYVAAPEEAVFNLPPGIDLERAAALANYQVAYHLLRDSIRPLPGQTILIHAAAGGMGTALVDLARAEGLEIIAVAGGTDKVAFVREQGVTHVIDRKAEGIGERVRQITAGQGVDFVIDPVAGPTLADNIGLLGPFGTLVLYGALGGNPDADALALLRGAMKNSLGVRQYSIHTLDHMPERRRAGMRALIAMLDSGSIRPRIHGHLPLSEAVHAHEMLESGQVLGKLLLQP